MTSSETRIVYHPADVCVDAPTLQHNFDDESRRCRVCGEPA